MPEISVYLKTCHGYTPFPFKATKVKYKRGEGIINLYLIKEYINIDDGDGPWSIYETNTNHFTHRKYRTQNEAKLEAYKFFDSKDILELKSWVKGGKAGNRNFKYFPEYNELDQEGKNLVEEKIKMFGH